MIDYGPRARVLLVHVIPDMVFVLETAKIGYRVYVLEYLV